MISLIVAVSTNNVIGEKNSLPWYLPKDFAFFKEKTMNKTIIMGRKTFESIGRPLPKRINVILSTNKKYFANGCIVTHSLNDAIKINNNEKIIIGGADIYQQAFNQVDTIFLTHVDVKLKGDAFFNFPKDGWKLISQKNHYKDEKHNYNFSFLTYQRIPIS